jgi:hypothetical protein
VIEVVTLAALAVLDLAVCGFRAAAGREGRLDKTAFYAAAVLRAGLLGLAAVGSLAGLAALLVATSPDAAATWAAGVAAADGMLDVYLVYAVLVLAALALYLLPIGDFRTLTTVIVLGPMTLVRPAVIVAGLVLGAARAGDGRVAVVVAAAGVTMLLFERLIGRRDATRWRRLLDAPAV